MALKQYRIVRKSGTWDNGVFAVESKSRFQDHWKQESVTNSLDMARGIMSVLEQEER